MALGLLLGGCASSDTRGETTAASTTSPDTSTTTTEPLDPGVAKRVALAEAVIDAFYSYDSASLTDVLGEVRDADFLLYYQGWAEGANYEVLTRMPCEPATIAIVSCSITVEDDLVQALRLDFNVTDEFSFSFGPNDELLSIATSSDDPAEVGEAFDWTFATYPELREGPCVGIFGAGPTPGECARAVVEAFAEYANQ